MSEKKRVSLVTNILTVEIIAAVLFMIIVYTLMLFLGNAEKLIEIVRVAITIGGGVIGIMYLVIKFRERQDAEKDLQIKEMETAERKLVEAVQQLGSEPPQIRIAGVYALADVADTYKGHYKQRVVDIMCGYLRTDRGPLPQEDPLNNYNDAACESTILKLMVDHLHVKGKDSQRTIDQNSVEDWSDCDFDFRNARFGVEVNFRDCIFRGKVDFSMVDFSSKVNFLNAYFKEEVSLKLIQGVVRRR